MRRAILIPFLVGCASSSTPPPATPAPTPVAAAPAATTPADPAGAPAGHDAQHHHAMGHRFEHADEWAKRFDSPARDAWQKPDVVLGAMQLQPNLVVADVGAGTGYFTVRLARAVTAGRVVATDIEPDMIRYLKERAQREHLGNIDAVLAGTDDPHLAPASVDRILVVDVWHHLADPVGYAKGLAAALRPGGSIAIVDFRMDATHGPPKEHRLLPEAIIGNLTAAGLAAELSPVVLPQQYIVIGKKGA